MYNLFCEQQNQVDIYVIFTYINSMNKLDAERLLQRQKNFYKSIEKIKLKKQEAARASNIKKCKKYYKKVARKNKQKRESLGDYELSTYFIYITKNKERIEFVGRNRYKSSAYKKYNKRLSQNETVLFPRIYERTTKYNYKPVKYEILLTEVNKDKYDNSTSNLKNDLGKFVDVEVEGRDNIEILSRDAIHIEEDFYIYGLDERKDAHYILNELILKPETRGFTTKRIYRYKNKVIIKTDYELDVVICKCAHEAFELAKTIYNNIPKNVKFVFYFSEELSLKSDVIDEVKELTGWTTSELNKIN